MSSFHGRSLDEREAASIVAGLHSNNNMNATTASIGAITNGGAATAGRKRTRVNSDGKRSKKKSSTSSSSSASKPAAKPPPMDATGLVFAQPELKPAPYFYYTDHSLEQDDDPLTPITAAGSVPTFPAKMHAILTNPDLADVVGWAPHGRSWRILKPRDFEIRVLPKYFEHSKLSSFVRQANGWGFRRLSQGYDKNAYYHEYFLRAMPWLCKKMRRPKVAEKKAVDPEMEPDLDVISAQLPVVDTPPTREVLVLQKTIELGPKARMPVLWDTGTPPAAPSSPVREAEVPPENPPVENLTAAAAALNSSASYTNLNLLAGMSHSASYGDLKPAAMPHSTEYGDLKPAALPTPPAASVAPVAPPPVPVPVAESALPVANTMLSMANNVQNNVQQFPQNNNNMLPPSAAMLAPATHQNNMNFMPAPATNQNNVNPCANYAAAQSSYVQSQVPQAPPQQPQPQLAAASVPDATFAAGFMAAQLFHSNQIRDMLSQAFLAGMPIPGNGNIMMPQAAVAAPTNPANLGTAFEILQRVGMGNNNMMYAAQPTYVQATPQPAPAVAVAASAQGGFVGNVQQNSLSDQAMQRLQQFSAYQAQMDAPQPPLPPHM